MHLPGTYVLTNVFRPPSRRRYKDGKRVEGLNAGGLKRGVRLIDVGDVASTVSSPPIPFVRSAER